MVKSTTELVTDCTHARYLPDYRSPLPAGVCAECGQTAALCVIDLDALPRTWRDRLRDVWRAVVMAWKAST